jgi:hypothetical protein
MQKRAPFVLVLVAVAAALAGCGGGGSSSSGSSGGTVDSSKVNGITVGNCLNTSDFLVQPSIAVLNGQAPSGVVFTGNPSIYSGAPPAKISKVELAAIKTCIDKAK